MLLEKRELTKLMATKGNPLAGALAEAEIVAAKAWAAWAREVVPYALAVNRGDVVRCAVTWKNNTTGSLSRHILTLYGVVEEGVFKVYVFTYEGVEYFVASYALASAAAGAQVVTNVDWRAMFAGYTFDVMVFTAVVTNPAEVTVITSEDVIFGMSSNMLFTYDDSRLVEDAVSVAVPAQIISVAFSKR